MAFENINVAPPKKVYDAIVVGSGITGGWAVKELTEKGLKVLLLERGRNVVAGKDYITEHKAPWEVELRGRISKDEIKEYPYISRTGFMDGYTKQFFFKDILSLYIEEKPFTWIRGYQLGGKSIIWGRQCYRWSDLDFEANLKEGIAVDWPIRYKDIAPWYDYVESYVGISGEKLNLPYLPDGIFQKPMELTVVEKALREQIRKNYPDRYLTVGRAAILTEPLNGRAPCHYCGPCERGCSTGSYFCSLSTTLPDATATGNLTSRPDSVVHSVIYDKEKNRASGVRVIDANTKKVEEYYGRIVFLCASTLNSTQIMLNSISESFPDGIANSSGVLGHYLMDHHAGVGAHGEMPGYEDHYWYGNRPHGCGFYIPRYRNLNEKTKMRNFVRGYGAEGDSGRSSWHRGRHSPLFGKVLKNKLHDPGPWSIGWGCAGETLPQYDNHIRLDDVQTDTWGIPLLRIKCEWGANELAMRKDMAESSAEMLETCGAKNVRSHDSYRPGQLGAEPGRYIHEMGTARMGRDPKTSVLNEYNQSHDIPNLFVTDGSCMTSSANQNPSITYMALTARAVDYAVKQLKKNNL